MHAITDGVGPVPGSEAYARGKQQRTNDPEAAIRRVIRESVVAAGAQGFLTGLGGFTTLPVAVPANLAGSLIINSRMVGSIAYLRDWDLDDPYTQVWMMLTIAGSSAQSAASKFGVKLGQHAAEQVIKAIPIAVIRKINQRAGFYLVAKYGSQRSVITLNKFVPGWGGLVGGTVDAALTRTIGGTAKKAFNADPDSCESPAA